MNKDMTLLHGNKFHFSDNTLIKAGNLIGINTVIGDFDPLDYDPHLHIEVNSKVDGHGAGFPISSSNIGDTIKMPYTDDKGKVVYKTINVAAAGSDDSKALLEHGTYDPAPYISIFQNIDKWQNIEGGTMALGSIGGNIGKSTATYADNLSSSNTKDAPDKLKFFLTQDVKLKIQLFTNDFDNKVDSEQIFNLLKNGITLEATIKEEKVELNKEKYIRTYDLEAGEYMLNVMSADNIKLAGVAPYWIKFDIVQ